MSNKYKQKYLKYKEKYLQLRIQSGGALTEDEFEELLDQAYRGNIAPVLTAVNLEPGLITRASGEKGQTILQNACAGGHVDLTRDLVDRQADLDQRDTLGNDALMCASYYGHIPVMEFLLSRGADMTARSKNGETALWFTAYYDRLPACKFLISKGYDIMSKNYDGDTVLDSYGLYKHLDDVYRKKKRKEELFFAAYEYEKKELEKLKEYSYPTSSLFLSDKHSDLIIKAGGEQFPAHKCILAAYKEMDAMLNGQWKEKVVNEIKFEESAISVKTMLRFIYMGKVDKNELLKDLEGVIILADKYDLGGLKEESEKYAIMQLLLDNVLEFIIMADLYKMDKLKHECIETIRLNRERITTSPEFIALETSYPDLWKELQAL
jgi:hypothetical protein